MTNLELARGHKMQAENADANNLVKTMEYHERKAILHFCAFIAETIAAQPSRETLSEIVNWTGEI